MLRRSAWVRPCVSVRKLVRRQPSSLVFERTQSLAILGSSLPGNLAFVAWLIGGLIRVSHAVPAALATRSAPAMVAERA